MSCEVQINTIDLLQKKNIIDDFSRDGRNRILKIIDFEKLNDKYTQLAKIKYPNLSILDGQLLFTIDEIEATDYSRLKYVRDVKYKTAWAVPNKELFDKIQIEFDKSRDPGPKEGEQLSLFMRTDASKPKTRLASTIYEIYPDITEKEIRKRKSGGTKLLTFDEDNNKEEDNTEESHETERSIERKTKKK